MPDWTKWEKTNDAYLAAALKWLRGQLSDFAERSKSDSPAEVARGESLDAVTAEYLESADPPPALEILKRSLGLSTFEQQVLLLCAALEFDPHLPMLCAQAQGDAQKPFPTFGLALAALPEPAWDVLSPERPLRCWRLVEVHQPNGAPLTGSALSADERIVSFLKGLNYLDERLAPLLSKLNTLQAAHLPPSQQSVVETIHQWLAAARGDSAGEAELPVIQLLGPHQASKQLIAQHVAAQLGVELRRLPIDLLPTAIGDLETLVRLWHRERLLLPMALYVDAFELETGGAALERLAALRRFLAASSGVVFLDSRETQQQVGRPSVSLEIRRPTQLEQRAAWTMELGDDSQQQAGVLSAQFDLCISAIQQIAQSVQQQRSTLDSESAADVWTACRRATRPRVEQLAQRIDAKATWEQIVLPDDETALLRQIASQVRRRTKVYDEWGYRAKLNRGLGISALFAGESGTGKTMAAEVIANELQLDLLRVDLSAVVNKYIGETEKNLRRIFDAAEEGGVVLFFDEADALFGKRTEVKDSHDRYANIEVNYLLQRMESYRGLAILATNMKTTLDKAFLRRIRFLVDFPFPAVKERKTIWKKTFPAETPLAGIDFQHLARLKLTGGNIHNIALNAAFTAADNGGVVTMDHILAEAKTELRKLNKPINAADFFWREARQATV